MGLDPSVFISNRGSGSQGAPQVDMPALVMTKQEKLEKVRMQWKKAAPAISGAVNERLKKMPVNAASLMVKLLLKEVRGYNGKPKNVLPIATTSARLTARYGKR